MRELLIGAGSNHLKRLGHNGNNNWDELTTLDYNADHKPDVVWDLNVRPLPFESDFFDEIHAYEVLEHLGHGQGDWKSWFAEWSEWYRLLKPNGVFCGTSPSLTSRWLWGDPSHRRAVTPESLTFLIQPEYTKQIGQTPMSDFRFVYKDDFDPVYLTDDKETFSFVMKAIKPSRISI